MATFTLSVLTDEISQDFGHACEVAAHEFGLAWFQQVRDAKGNISFKQHPIMGAKAMANSDLA